jgi:hypothetical protein
MRTPPVVRHRLALPSASLTWAMQKKLPRLLAWQSMRAKSPGRGEDRPPAWGHADSSRDLSEEQGMADAERVEDAAEAYIYGYPLVYDLKEVAGFVEGGGSLPMQAPCNAFASRAGCWAPRRDSSRPTTTPCMWAGSVTCVRVRSCCTFPTHTTVTTCSSSWTPGPTTSPTSGGSATGTAEAEYLLADRDYDGPVPDGMTVVAVPTGCSPSSGGPAQRRGRAAGRPRPPGPVHPHQPGSPYRRSGPRRGRRRPKPDPRVRDELQWWERFRVALAAFPRPPADKQFVALAKRVGATAAESPYVDPDPGLAEVLVAGQQAGQAKLEELARWRGCTGRLVKRPAPVRLQPGPSRPGDHRRAGMEDARPRHGLDDPGR